MKAASHSAEADSVAHFMANLARCCVVPYVLTKVILALLLNRHFRSLLNRRFRLLGKQPAKLIQSWLHVLQEISQGIAGASSGLAPARGSSYAVTGGDGSALEAASHLLEGLDAGSGRHEHSTQQQRQGGFDVVRSERSESQPGAAGSFLGLPPARGAGAGAPASAAQPQPSGIGPQGSNQNGSDTWQSAEELEDSSTHSGAEPAGVLGGVGALPAGGAMQPGVSVPPAVQREGRTTAPQQAAQHAGSYGSAPASGVSGKSGQGSNTVASGAGLGAGAVSERRESDRESTMGAAQWAESSGGSRNRGSGAFSGMLAGAMSPKRPAQGSTQPQAPPKRAAASSPSNAPGARYTGMGAPGSSQASGRHMPVVQPTLNSESVHSRGRTGVQQTPGLSAGEGMSHERQESDLDSLLGKGGSSWRKAAKEETEKEATETTIGRSFTPPPPMSVEHNPSFEPNPDVSPPGVGKRGRSSLHTLRTPRTAAEAAPVATSGGGVSTGASGLAPRPTPQGGWTASMSPSPPPAASMSTGTADRTRASIHVLKSEGPGSPTSSVGNSSIYSRSTDVYYSKSIHAVPRGSSTAPLHPNAAAFRDNPDLAARVAADQRAGRAKYASASLREAAAARARSQDGRDMSPSASVTSLRSGVSVSSAGRRRARASLHALPRTNEESSTLLRNEASSALLRDAA